MTTQTNINNTTAAALVSKIQAWAAAERPMNPTSKAWEAIHEMADEIMSASVKDRVDAILKIASKPREGAKIHMSDGWSQARWIAPGEVVLMGREWSMNGRYHSTAEFVEWSGGAWHGKPSWNILFQEGELWDFLLKNGFTRNNRETGVYFYMK